MTATSSRRRAEGLDSSLNKLNLSSPPRKSIPTSSSSSNKSKPAPLPDSWEEEASNDNAPSDPPSDASTPVVSGTTTPQGGDYPGPPPPTPISPSHRRGNPTDWAAFPSEPSGRTSHPMTASSPRQTSRGGGGGGGVAEDGKRPEKSAATAGRMIAMGLGQKVPKMGEEQRQYERAVREKEKRRVGREKEERERERREAEEAKRSVWEE